MSILDAASMTEDDLRVVIDEAQTELSRRATLAAAPAEAAKVSVAYLRAAGRAPGEPWVQPEGAHDAYPQGWQVAHGGKLWVSTTAGNVWEPGASGWREASASGEPVTWLPPTGAHDAYSQGDQVTWGGQVWVSISEANVWEPGTFGWDPAPAPEQPEEPGDPAPAAPEQPAEQPAAPKWVQPTGGHDAYAKGAIVLHNGQTWSSNTAGNVWEPGVYGWTVAG